MPKIYLDKEAPGRYRATMRTRNGKVTALATVTFPKQPRPDGPEVRAAAMNKLKAVADEFARAAAEIK
jgi:hypothetical protein